MSERNADVQPDAGNALAAPAAAAGATNTATTAGAMLRRLREAAGVDPVLLASAMKVSPQKLDALENDRLDLLPDITFARGLASAICRAFGADPAPVLERMPVSAPGLRPPTQNINQPFRRTGDRPVPMLASNFSRPLLFAVAALVLGAAALWFLPTLPIQLNPPAPAETPAAAEPGRDTAPPVPAVEPTPSEMPLGAASAEQTAPASSAAPAAAPAVVNNAELVQFTAKAETWVTVRDAAGKQLINRALAAGETVGVTGDVPLAITIGRKDAVDVTVRGQPFDHRSLSKTTVSRFQVK